MSQPDWLGEADRHSPWRELSVVVAGLDVWGYASADALVQAEARVTVLDDGQDDVVRERATILEILEASVRLGPGATAALPAGTDLVVTSPENPADLPLLVDAAAAGVPVWGEAELAWRMRDPATPWLAVTGATGAAATVRMLAEILRASGLRAVASGGDGEPVMSAVLDPIGYDVIAVELSGRQLHWTSSMVARSAAVLAAGTLDEPHQADLARIYSGVELACVYNVADPATEQMVRDAEVTEGARAIGITLGIPAVGMLGLVDDILVDRAFIAERHPPKNMAAELASVADLDADSPDMVVNALAAAALARSIDVPAVAVRDGLRASGSG